MTDRSGPFHRDDTRRYFLQAMLATAGLAFGACAARSHEGEEEADEAEVTPGEDLMQEHGVLRRILLIYDESAARLEGRRDLDLAVVASGAEIVRRFVEDYHERAEEKHVFPRFDAVHLRVDLVATLRLQHERGREVTEEILRLSHGGTKNGLAPLLRSFAHMYRPHAAREDTVLFPAFRSLLGRDQYRELGEQFEENEHELLGAHGFRDTVEAVARIEESLGIHDLAQFTPPPRKA